MPRSLLITVAPAIRAGRWLMGLGHWLRLCLHRGRQRKALAELSDHQLRDIGLMREQVRREIAKRPWG